MRRKSWTMMVLFGDLYDDIQSKSADLPQYGKHLGITV
jgi:hypothetical protein